ncbi:Pkinase_Tyr domain-containing protein [Cephalotus follicularis]|uniref:Pkinase_Tyr domain-containing protein n=1 Tax=Cephalotus follicularis TaxID=3775 RepID=A0A1Q3B9X7_CEPFO|nr:Pkinase_Tyr domain-containing protein [Cephalotus follicularis]
MCTTLELHCGSLLLKRFLGYSQFNAGYVQVIGAVGFMNQRLEIPKHVDPQWASIIESCWHSDLHCQPTFQELLEKLRDLQRQYAIQFQASRATAGDSTPKES